MVRCRRFLGLIGTRDRVEHLEFETSFTIPSPERERDLTFHRDLN